MASNVVITGGGFGGLYAARRLERLPAWFAARTYHLATMPGVARRLRLSADRTVGVFFGRASAALGQLGHPPGLGDELREEQVAAPPEEGEPG